MIIDIESMYLTIVVVIVMLALAVITIKRLLNTRSKFTSFLMVIEEIIVSITVIGTFALLYKAMENYDLFAKKYGELTDILTYLSIYFCISQIGILVLTYIYRFINKRRKFIKDRRIIK